MSKNNTLSMSPNFFVSGGVLLAILPLYICCMQDLFARRPKWQWQSEGQKL